MDFPPQENLAAKGRLGGLCKAIVLALVSIDTITTMAAIQAAKNPNTPNGQATNTPNRQAKTYAK